MSDGGEREPGMFCFVSLSGRRGVDRWIQSFDGERYTKTRVWMWKRWPRSGRNEEGVVSMEGGLRAMNRVASERGRRR